MSIVIITGGSRGLGASAAIQCARRGMGVILTYNNNPDAAAGIVRTIRAGGGKAVALKLDVAESASFPAFRETLRSALAETWGCERFNALVNNAGYGLFRPIEKVSEDEFDGLYRVHLKGPFFLTQALLPLIADGGQILNVASATARVATPGVAPYAAFKGAL